MKTEIIVEQHSPKVNLILDCQTGIVGKDLSADEAEKTTQLIKQATQEAGREAFKMWLLQFECHTDVLVHEGKTYRFKMIAEKEFLTEFGHLTLPRRVFQQDNGGPTFVPLDTAWDMVGEFATREVRECVLYMSALMTPAETQTCLQKTAAFHPSRTAIQNLVTEMGERLEQCEDIWLDEVRRCEELPLEETQVFTISLDGVNIRLNTPGKKKGRPTERPKDADAMSRDSASCYKNVMVGVCSLYGKVPENKDSPTRTPERLYGSCVARMPEDQAAAFKQKLEKEVEAMVSRLPEDVTKIVLMDGGRNLWGYVDSHPKYEGYEKILDFHHTLEHLSQGAEGLFGKGTQESQAWYRKMEGLLLEREEGAVCVIRSLEYYLLSYEYKETSRGLIQSCLTFFCNNKHRMEYKRFRDNGWPIGSGPVEGACKNIVKLRMCRSGMRWSLRGGQTILTLRSIVKSNRWELFWNAYKQQNKLPVFTHSP